MTLPAPAVTTADVAEVVEEPVDVGLVAVVRVVWAPLPLPVADPVPVATAVLAVTEVVTEADTGAVAVLTALLLLGTLDTLDWLAEEDDVEETTVWLETLLLTTEVVLETLPAVILKGKLYWKMVVSESSWSFSP